jgi:hypothetical protein
VQPNVAASVAVDLHAMAMAYAPALDTETIAYIGVTSAFSIAWDYILAFGEAHVAQKTHATILIRKVWPYYVIENMRLDCVYG